jgi:hypothetical protein
VRMLVPHLHACVLFETFFAKGEGGS